MASEILTEMADVAGLEFTGGKKAIDAPQVATDELGNLSIVWEAEQIQVQVNEIERNRRELSCYLSVRDFSQKPVRWICAPVRVNLLSSSAKTSLRRELEPRKALDWASRLDQVVVAVHRAASEQRKVGVLKPKTDFLEQDWVLGPLVERNQHTMLVAAGGTGKSLLSLGLCAAMATGVAIIPEIIPAQFDMNCLYLDWETDQETHERRLTQICAGAGVPFPEGRIHYIRMSVSLAEDIQFLHEYIVKNRIGFVVNDSVGMATSGDINSQEDAIRYVSAVRALGSVTALSIHHVGWGDTGRNTGSRYFENAARSVWVLEKKQDAAATDTHIDLVHRKANNGILQASIGLRAEFGDAIRYYSDVVSDDQRGPSDLVFELLSDTGRMDLQSIYAELEETPKPSIRQALGRLVKRGAVIRWEGTARKNPEYGISVTESPRHRDNTNGVRDKTPSKEGGLYVTDGTPGKNQEEETRVTENYRKPYPDDSDDVEALPF